MNPLLAPSSVASLLGGNQLQQELPPSQQPPDPFMWGQGGQRMTAEDIARRRAIADQQTLGDYSPVGHWTQGLGRVLDGFTGGLEQRRLDKAQDANQAARGEEIAALLGEGNADLASGFSSRDPVTQALAGQLLKGRMAPAKPTDLQRNYEWLVANGRQADADALIEKSTDPTRWTPFVDPASGQLSFMPIRPSTGPILGNVEGGGLASGGAVAPGSQPTNNGDIGFASFDAAMREIQGSSPETFLRFQQQYGTPVQVTSPEQMAALPSGALVMGPNGEVRRKP